MELYLTGEEKQMLKGEFGEGIKFAIEIIVNIAHALEARELVEIKSSHILAHYGSLHDAGIELMEKLVRLGARCRVPATVDPASIDLENWKAYQIPEEYAQKQMRLCDATKNLGVIQNWSCIPYQGPNIPKPGDNIAWAESSAVSFANSVIGARTNRTPAGLDVCAAITGRIPKVGLYLKENRAGTVLVDIKLKNIKNLDYHTIGYIVGKTVGVEIPVIKGLPETVTANNLKCLGAAAASSGSVALYHVYGVTPEATGVDPFGGKKPKKVIVISESEIREAERKISTGAHSEKVDIITLGCPHLDIDEIKEISKLFVNRKVKKDVEFWIYTNKENRDKAIEKGYIKPLVEAGVKISVQTCATISPISILGFRCMMTDSAKCANIVPTEHGMEVIYASTEECVEAGTITV